MFEGFGWKKRQGEKREMVNKETGEAVPLYVVDNKDQVIGTAASDVEAKQVVTEDSEQLKEAA